MLVEISRLRTSLAPLRGERTDRSDLAPLPLRVAAAGDAFEVLDGFKRLALWRAEGRTEVSVVVEAVETLAAMKARLLDANTPAKTAGPVDEARVVASLRDEDQLSEAAIAKLLGRKPLWVERRLALARRLCPQIATRLDRGRLSLTVALALCAFGRTEQKRLGDVVDKHALTSREAHAFLATWRAATDAPTREALVRDPRSATPAASDQGGSPLGATAADIAAKLDALEETLRELPALDFSGLSDAERRVLDARRRQILTLLQETVDGPHGTRGDPPTGPADVDPRDRQETWSRRQDDPSGARATDEDADAFQTGAFQGTSARTGGEGTLRPADPARDPGARLHRRPDDARRLSPVDPAPGEVQRAGPSVRDEEGQGDPDRLEPVPPSDRRRGAGGALLLDGPLLVEEALHPVLPRRTAPDAPLRAR